MSRSPNRAKPIPVGRDTNSNDTKSLRCRLFIGNLATDKISKNDIEELFSKYGEIASCSLHNNFGFVQFVNEKDADAAVAGMHGTSMFGKRIDVNLAGLRRKSQPKDKVDAPPRREDVVPPEMMKYGSEKRPPRSSSYRSRSPVRGGRNESRRSISPMSRYEELYRRDDREYPPYERGERYPPERRTEPYYLREDTYARRPAYDEYRSPYARTRPAIDCEVVSLSKEESRYADEVESRLRSIGLVCNIGYPPPELTVPELINRIARCGTLYAVVVSPQNAQHRSCTLNVLHSTRQEHRNMPLDDALSFVARNFDSYLRLLREPYYPSPVQSSYARDLPRDVSRDYPPASSYQSTVAPSASAVGSGAQQTEKQLSTAEISEMIEKLKKEKEEREHKEPYSLQPASTEPYSGTAHSTTTAAQYPATPQAYYAPAIDTNGTQKSVESPYYPPHQQPSYYSESTAYR